METMEKPENRIFHSILVLGNLFPVPLARTGGFLLLLSLCCLKTTLVVLSTGGEGSTGGKKRGKLTVGPLVLFIPQFTCLSLLFRSSASSCMHSIQVL